MTHKYVFDYHPGRHLLLRRRHRLGHRPQLHPLRAARQRRDDGDVRVDPHLPGPGPLLADGRRPRDQHLLHGADGDPRDRPRRRRVGEEVQARHRCASSARSASRSTPRSGCWYHDVVGDGRCAVVDTWWQTETGGIMITPLPGATPLQAGLGDAAVLRRPAGARRRARATELDGQRRLRQPLPARHLAGAGAHASTATTGGSARPTSRSSPASTSPATAAGATRTATTGSPAASTTC